MEDGVVGLVEFQSKKGKKSDVWLHYGFPKYGDGRVDKQHVICKICNECQPYKSATTNMRAHLDRKHWKETREQQLVRPTAPLKAANVMGPTPLALPALPSLPAQSTLANTAVKVEPGMSAQPSTSNGQVQQPSLLNFMSSKKPYAKDSSKAKIITRSLAEFVATDMRPLSIVEGIGFRNLLNVLDPRYQVISRNHLLERYIVPMYHVTTSEVMADIAKAPAHSFTTDAWSSSTMQSYITTTVHYIDPTSFELKSNVLNTNAVTGSHTGERLAIEMETTERKWGLHDVKGVSDNASNIQKAFGIHGIPHLGCFAHTINLGVGKGLEEPSVKRLLGKVRSLVSTFKQSYLKTEDLHANEKLLDIKNLQLIQDVATRWNSSYYMVDRLLQVYPAVYSSLYGKPHQNLLLTDDDRKLLEDLHKVLKPFENATRKVSAEKEPTGGLILPYLQRFIHNDLAVAAEDSPMLRKVKDLIKKDLQTRYQDPEKRSLLGLITVLDPRTRGLDWMDNNEKDVVYDTLKKECLRICPGNGPTEIKVECEEPADEVPGPPEKKLKVDEADDSDDDLGCVVITKVVLPKTQEDLICDELALYRQEPSLGTKYKETLLWWKVHQHKYPRLTQVMLRYLHVPASSVPSERVFSTAGGVFSKRDHLDPENADMLVFLYHNFRKYKDSVLDKWRNIV